MTKTIDLERYRDKTYLELVLTLVDEAHEDMIKGNYDLAQSQLSDVLEIFDKACIKTNESMDVADVIPFHSS
jgi:hypothetical protein